MRCKVTSAAARLVDGRESQSEASTSAAARSPDRMAPSMLPCDSVVVPLPPIVTSIVNCSPMPWRTSVSLYDAEYAPDGTRLFRISGTFVYRGTPILPGSFTAQQFRDGMDTQFAAGVTAQTAGPPANLANSPLAATLRSMQCCGTPR
jgi:hypothetical protein